MPRTLRGKYISHLSRVYNHLDYYLQEAFKNRAVDELPMSDIRVELKNSSNIKIRKDTILKYNARQFSRYQTAPLEWAGDDIFSLNESYYRLLREKVFAPRIGKRGPPRKYRGRAKQSDAQP